MQVSLDEIRWCLSEVFSFSEEKALLKRHPEKMLVFLKVLSSLINVDIMKNQDKRAFWLPSSAHNPDPVHMHFYGMWLDEIPNGEVPGQRYGCKCGIGYK